MSTPVQVTGAGIALFTTLSSAVKAASITRQIGEIVPDPMSQNPLAEPLIRIGEIAIARENDAALDAYFAPGFQVSWSSRRSDLRSAQILFRFAACRLHEPSDPACGNHRRGQLSGRSDHFFWNVRQCVHSVAGWIVATERPTYRVGGYEPLPL